MQRLRMISSLCLVLLFSSKVMAINELTKAKIIRIPLLTAKLTPKKTVQRVEVKKIKFLPTQKSGLHVHSCPVVGYIATGSIYFQVEGKKAKTLHAGDVFFEPAGTKILHFDNSSKTKAASFVAFYLLNKSDKKLIKMIG